MRGRELGEPLTDRGISAWAAGTVARGQRNISGESVGASDERLRWNIRMQWRVRWC